MTFSSSHLRWCPLFFGAALLTACASTVVPDHQVEWVQPKLKPSVGAPSQDAGSLIVKRDAGGGTGAVGCNHRIQLDGEPIADLMPGQGVKIFAPAGRHVVGLTFTAFLCNTGESALSVNLSAVEPTILRTITSPDNRGQIVPSAR